MKKENAETMVEVSIYDRKHFIEFEFRERFVTLEIDFLCQDTYRIMNISAPSVKTGGCYQGFERQERFKTEDKKLISVNLARRIIALGEVIAAFGDGADEPSIEGLRNRVSSELNHALNRAILTP